MTPHITTEVARPPNRQVSPADAVRAAQASLALLHELEASLEATQKAVLARDLARLDEGTREQIRLEQAFREQWTQCRTLCQETPASSSLPIPLEPRCAAELRTAATHVLDHVRVQAALLIRAQRSLRMLASLAGRTELSYRPRAADLQGCPPSFPTAPGDESLCRV